MHAVCRVTALTSKRIPNTRNPVAAGGDAFQGRQSEGAVAARPGQHDAYRLALALIRDHPPNPRKSASYSLHTSSGGMISGLPGLSYNDDQPSDDTTP